MRVGCFVTCVEVGPRTPPLRSLNSRNLAEGTAPYARGRRWAAHCGEYFVVEGVSAVATSDIADRPLLLLTVPEVRGPGQGEGEEGGERRESGVDCEEHVTLD